jgi:DNA-binding XRE family transcriptional regulator
MPRVTPDESLCVLLSSARRALSRTQEGLGQLLGSSRRTAGRWEAGRVHPSSDQIRDLARAVYPHGRLLAAQLAEQAGDTLLSLELERPPAPPPPPAPQPPPPAPAASPRPLAPIALMVESVVCAAAEALDTRPAAVRDVIRAAFQRARAMSLTVEEVSDALTPPRRAEAAAPAKARVKAR